MALGPAVSGHDGDPDLEPDGRGRVTGPLPEPMEGERAAGGVNPIRQMEETIRSYIDDATRAAAGHVEEAIKDSAGKAMDLTKPFMMGVAVGGGSVVVALVALVIVGAIFLQAVVVIRGR